MALNLITVAGVASAAALAFGFSALQSLINARHGTDHAVHAFLIRAIRANRFRLFVPIPRLLNKGYCAALPLYLHWIFAHFSSSAMRWAEKLLNPSVNALHVLFLGLMAAIAAGQAGLDAEFVVLTALLFAATPQFYHALSARNFGLSARSIGLILLSLFFFAIYCLDAAPAEPYLWALLVGTGYLIWAFSTFAAQALVLFSLLLMLMGRFTPVFGALLGLVLFVAVHPTYSIGYLRHTVRFIRTYAIELAPLYILNRRYSIWRDLVWDMWAAIRRNPIQGLRYAYENSIIVVAVLNPLLLLAIGAGLFGMFPQGGIAAFASEIALCGGGAMLLTSFRATRFLGEPERYVEAVTPWATLAGSLLIFNIVGASSALIVLIGFLSLAALQLWASKLLSRYLSRKPFNLEAVEAAVKETVGEDVRCCSNNEQLTKLLMHNDWDFAYCIAVGQDYCGMTISEAFSTFPFLRREACQRIVESCRINVCALDRSLYDTIFDTPPPALRRSRVIYETEGLRVFALDWDEPSS